tara:strand:- start:2583 stop:3230 length:648 start_codon:yes stop_codon:yes gene_type:complete
MSIIIERFNKIKFNINSLKPIKPVNIVAVSKTFSLSHIQPLINHGHNHFGENKVQEAVSKWREVKKNSQLNLHMIGKLQSNKVREAIQIFDYIHSLDNQKLADVIAKRQIELNKEIKFFIQVNIGNELQKSGIPVDELDAFYNYCTVEKNLKIVGLMIIPPNDKNTKKYFNSLNELSTSLALQETSMGMSADYLDAVRYGSTYVRIGSSIFGDRS